MKLQFILGDTEEIELIVIDKVTRIVQDITGWSFWFTIKRDNALPDEKALLQKTVGDGIQIVTPANGLIRITVYLSDRTALNAGSNYKFDIQCKDSEGRIVTISGAGGIIEILADTTHAIS